MLETENPSISDVASQIISDPLTMSPAELLEDKYPPGFTFNRLRRDGSLQQIVIERYYPSNKVFAVSASIGERLTTDTKMSLERVEAMNAPELQKHPVGTHVMVPLEKGEKVEGIMAGYLKDTNVYVIRVHKENKKPELIQVSRESFEAVNYRGRVEELLN